MAAARPEEDWAEVFAPGEWVPEEVLRQRLAACGAGVRVYRGARLVHPERIAIGARTQIDEGVRIFAGQGVRLGRHVHLAFESSISGGGRCEVGDFVSVGAAVRIITGTDVPDGSGLTNPTVPPEYRVVKRGEVVLEDHVLLFTGALVLPGVRIGEGAVVAAGGLVHRDLEPWRIYAGNPLVPVGIRPRETILRLARETLLRHGSDHE
ncbi:MAG: acyltransferase [Verrucomicrobia bacterium]|nr:MAG: acyltransferase [Verrucomicrobiota bacterium]